jgi:hypothetical protein
MVLIDEPIALLSPSLTSLLTDAACRLRRGQVLDVDVLVARLILKCAEGSSLSTFGHVAAAFTHIGVTLSAADVTSLEISNVVARALRLLSEEAVRGISGVVTVPTTRTLLSPRDAARALLEAEASASVRNDSNSSNDIVIGGNDCGGGLSTVTAAIIVSKRAAVALADSLNELIDELENVDAGELLLIFIMIHTTAAYRGIGKHLLTIPPPPSPTK